MSLLEMASTAVNPYLLYIKIALVALMILMITGVAWYIKSTFAEKDKLLQEKAKLEFTLAMEQQKVIVAMEQLKIWQDTVAKMNAAIKNIKIESNTTIQGVENEAAPEFANRKSIPFILSVMSGYSSMSRFTPDAARGAGSPIKTGRAIP